MIGQVLGGRYKITELIGSGGMAQVFRAQDTVLGRIVAVKLMLPQFATDDEFKTRFRQEASAIANLQSPFIVNVYDWGEEGQNYYIVMEFVRGTNLKTGMKLHGALNQRKVAEIGMQVCQSLSVAHNQDIVHRDIKPQNIMVQPDGNVKVMDFGIAHAKNTLKDKTTNVLGTAHYISPEQAQGKDVGQQSDLYSLGCCLYEAATGKLPFDGDDAVSVAMKQVNEIPPLPSTINQNIDPNLERIIMHAIEKDPKRRYSTANEMRDDLVAFLNGSVPRSGAGVSATQVIPSAVAAGAAIGVGAAGDLNSKSAKNFNATNNTKKKSRKSTVIAIISLVILIAVGVFFLVQCMGSETVPDVRGMSKDEGITTIRNTGFDVGSIKYQNDDSVEENRIVETNPKVGSKVEKGQKIDLILSSGKEDVAVPDLKGMTQDQAKKSLETLGLSMQVGEFKYSSDVAEDHVCGQNPSAGDKVHKGDTVIINLSKGQDKVSVPDVRGMTQANATNTLQSMGFNVNVTKEKSSSVAAGNAISQSPTAGTKAERGSTVTIVVSNGSEQVAVPSVVGKTVAEATSILQSAGFNITFMGNSSSSAKIIAQSPSGGTADKGSTVTITGQEQKNTIE
ncbi:MAG: Stk1 family PASTA domain-containing Ser/Thr kinase [Eggerthellaceae bacterium]|nr:Stk1 family PASTA domain-containing Ser/Thr kinase [Eggerthellaceae bacterium]